MNNNKYRKTKEIAVECDSEDCDCLFPQQYLKSKCLIVNKNGLNANIIQKKENGDFIVLQSIQFNTEYIYGQLSDDGEYLITWDNNSMLSKQESVRNDEHYNIKYINKNISNQYNIQYLKMLQCQFYEISEIIGNFSQLIFISRNV